jgi:hypothetical protein
VPGLYHKEMQRRRTFNTSNSNGSSNNNSNNNNNSNSNSGPLQEDPSIFTSEDSISLSLEYYDRWVVGLL